ncbi:MAG: acetate--CoA ligase family protein, partial [Hyphomicrobiales bacterium]|nr:acetate--CoA ligase family protein [Hyphomicrobiales bacterium]
LLAGAGIAVPRGVRLGRDEMPDAACAGLRPPFALKAIARALVHKSDAGGVALGLADAAAGMRDRLAGHGLEGFLVEEMAPAGHELVLGGLNDARFGPLVMVGLGGIFVELLRDFSLRLAPVGLEEAHAMLRELKGFKLLEGARGRPSSDKEAIARAIVDLSSFALAHAHEIVSCDINPFLVLSKGAVALDAVIVRKSLPEKEEE